MTIKTTKLNEMHAFDYTPNWKPMKFTALFERSFSRFRVKIFRPAISFRR